MTISSPVLRLVLACLWTHQAVWSAPGPWVSTDGPEGGIVNAISLHGHIGLVATRNDLFRSTDFGESWISDVAGLVAGSVIEGVDNEGTFALLNTRTHGTFRSIDGGKTWDRAEELPAFSGVLHINDGVGHVAVNEGGNASLWRTDDAGATWARLADLPDPAVSLLVTDGNIFAGSGFAFGILRSTDGGTTWERLTTGLPIDLVDNLVSTQNAIIATTANSGVYRSTDGGDQWVASNEGFDNLRGISDLSATDGHVTVTFFGDGIYHSTDQGRSWERATGLDETQHRWVSAIDAGADGTVLAGLYDHGVFRSDNGGQHWEPSNRDLTASSVLASASDDNTLLVSTGARVLSTSTHGVTWSRPLLVRDPASFAWSIASVGPGTFLSGTLRDGIFRTTDNGEHWHTVNGGFPRYNGTAGLQYREAEHIARAGDAIYVGTGFGMEMIGGSFVTTGGGVFRSTSGGTTWIEANMGLPNKGRDNFGNFVYQPVVGLGAGGTGALVALTREGIFRSTDRGESWRPASVGLPTSTFGNPPDIVRFANNEHGVFAAAQSFPLSSGASGRGVFRSADLGQSWERASSGLPGGIWVNSVATAGPTVFAAVANLQDPTAESGVYRSDDGGVSWNQFGLEGMAVSGLTVDGKHLMASVHSRGVWRCRLDTPPTADPVPGIRSVAPGHVRRPER